MKLNNIILLDRNGVVAAYLLQNTQSIICTLVAESNSPTIQNLRNNFSDRILNFIDYNDLFSIQHVREINYSHIKKLKGIQLDIETMLHRIMLNNPVAKDIYHQHLSFFTHIFKEYNIDLILCSEFNLSTPNHLIPFGIGKLLGIPTYALEAHPSSPAISINNYNNNTRVALQGNCAVDISKMAYYQHKHQTHKGIKNLVRKSCSKIGGELLIEFMNAIFIKRSFTKIYLGYPYHFFDKLKAYLALKKAKRTYQKYSSTLDLSSKYLYYSLHMEPEATVIGKTTLESQLTIIKMLSNVIPKDWNIIVKEHPHQFMLNNLRAHYFIHNIFFFKNSFFYKKLSEIQNVVIAPLNFSPKTLIKNCISVATISGTVTLEALMEKKPTILFSAQSALYGILNNVLSITSYQDLQEAIQKIQDGFADQINPEAGFEILQKYLSNTQDPNFYPNLFSTIEEHAKTIKPTGESL